MAAVDENFFYACQKMSAYIEYRKALWLVRADHVTAGNTDLTQDRSKYSDVKAYEAEVSRRNPKMFLPCKSVFYSKIFNNVNVFE